MQAQLRVPKQILSMCLFFSFTADRLQCWDENTEDSASKSSPVPKSTMIMAEGS